MPILVKIDQEMRPWECPQTDTHRQIHWQTDANQFYNLSHAICYSYGTDKKTMYCILFLRLSFHTLSTPAFSAPPLHGQRLVKSGHVGHGEQSPRTSDWDRYVYRWTGQSRRWQIVAVNEWLYLNLAPAVLRRAIVRTTRSQSSSDWTYDKLDSREEKRREWITDVAECVRVTHFQLMRPQERIRLRW